MEEKIIKQIKTQCPFPLLIYKTHIKYNEVRKASGIAYILLELISKQQSDMSFQKALLKFGIPTELHILFGNELAGLMKTEIVSSVYLPSHFENSRYFAEIKLNDVKLTAKGQKLFREGAIPTGLEKEIAKDIFFSPVTKKIDVRYSLPYSPLAGCFLGDEFMDNVEIDISGLEDYLNANLSKVGLKAEERMISFETEEPQKMNVRAEENITLNIYPSNLEFTFASAAERAFFDKYYSSAIMQKGMAIKDKFKFPNAGKPLCTVEMSDIKNLIGLYLPNEFAKQAKRPCVVFLQRSGVDFERNDVICADKTLSCELLDMLDKNAQFALFDKSGGRYYLAVNVAMPCKNFGDTFTLPLLTESTAEPNTVRAIVERLYEEYCEKPLDDECAKVVKYVVDVLNDGNYFSKFIENKLCSVAKADEKIELLLKLHSLFNRHALWWEYFKDTATKLYNDCIGEVKVENIIYMNTVLSPLKEELQIADSDYICKFSENICKTESKEIVYEALNSVGFSASEILSVANIADNLMAAVLGNEPIDSETALAAKYKTVRTNLWKLNDLLGIESNAEYTLRDDYNADEFFNAYSTLHSAVRAIEEYRQFAPKEYEAMERYLAIFEPIHEILSIERTSASHPDKITKEYIDDYIDRGKYKDAICDLLVKLQYDLRDMLQADRGIQANELINNAVADKLITKQQADALHKLRICRNGFQHPERKQIPFDKPTIENWRDIVFIIGGEK